MHQLEKKFYDLTMKKIQARQPVDDHNEDKKMTDFMNFINMPNISSKDGKSYKLP